MKTSFYFPAPVEVVKVTNENLAEVAEWCGGKVASTESRRVPGRQDSYVWVPTPKGNSVSWAFPGMFITKRMVVTIKDEMKATYAVFRKDYFNRNYFDTPTEAVDKTWEKFEKNKQKANGNNVPTPAAPKPRATYKTKAEIEHDKQTEQAPVKEFNFDKYAHNHTFAADCPETCPSHSAETGIHIYHDTRITIDNTTKENDMERSKHGYPILTTEESAQLNKELQEAELNAAVEVVKEVIPGSELIEESVIGFDAFAGGQALEGGEIVIPETAGSPDEHHSFAGTLDDGTDEYHEASQES